MKYYKDMTANEQLEWAKEFAQHQAQIALIEEYIKSGKRTEWTASMGDTINKVSQMMAAFQQTKSFAEQVAFDSRTSAFARAFVQNITLIRNVITKDMIMQDVNGNQYMYIPALNRPKKRGRPSETELNEQERMEKERLADIRKTKVLADMLGMKVITDEQKREKNNEELAAERAQREAEEKAKNPTLFQNTLHAEPTDESPEEILKEVEKAIKDGSEKNKNENEKQEEEKPTEINDAVKSALDAAKKAEQAAKDAKDAAEDSADSAAAAADSADDAGSAANTASDAADDASDAADNANNAASEAADAAEKAKSAVGAVRHGVAAPFDPSAPLNLRQLRIYLSPELAEATDKVRDLRATASASAERAKQMADDGRPAEEISVVAKESQNAYEQYQRIFAMVDEEMAMLYGRLKDDAEYYANGDGKKFNRESTMEVAKPYWQKADEELRARIQRTIDENNPKAVAERERKAKIKKEADDIIKYLRRRDKKSTQKRLDGMTEKMKRLHELIGKDADAYQPFVEKCRKEIKAK